MTLLRDIVQFIASTLAFLLLVYVAGVVVGLFWVGVCSVARC